MKANYIDEMTVKRYISAGKVRNICIENGYYTRGDNEAYSKMLDSINVKDEFNDEKLKSVAVDIYNHSDIENMMLLYGIDELEVMEHIVYTLVNGSSYKVTVATVDFE